MCWGNQGKVRLKSKRFPDSSPSRGILCFYSKTMGCAGPSEYFIGFSKSKILCNHITSSMTPLTFELLVAGVWVLVSSIVWKVLVLSDFLQHSMMYSSEMNNHHLMSLMHFDAVHNQD